MQKLVVHEAVIRKLINEALDGPAKVNPVVDPSAAVTDPIDVDFVPQNKVELGIAFSDMIKPVTGGNVPAAYKAVKAAIEDLPEEGKDKEGNPVKKQDKDNNLKVEEAIRHLIRATLAENPAHKRRAAYKPDALGNMDDVGGMSFEDIAGRMGFSVAGAKQAVGKAMGRLGFLAKMDSDDRELMLLSAINDYIDYLATSGELAPADIQLMKNHPDIIAGEDEFREFFHKIIRKQMKEKAAEEAQEQQGD